MVSRKPSETSLIRPTDDEARSMAQGLLKSARFAALAVTDPNTQSPFVSRIALLQTERGELLSLISDLALHTQALNADSACALLVGEPGNRGDPLVHPRLTVQARATFVARGTKRHQEMAMQYLHSHPKAKLYLSLGDFGFVQFDPIQAFLNGGFGRAFLLRPTDLLSLDG